MPDDRLPQPEVQNQDTERSKKINMALSPGVAISIFKFLVEKGEKDLVTDLNYNYILSVLLADGGVKGKDVLEIGYRQPEFLMLLKRLGANAVAGLDLRPPLILDEETENFPEYLAIRDNLKMGSSSELDIVFPGQMFDNIVSKNVFEMGSIFPEDSPLGAHTFEDFKRKTLKAINKKLVPGGFLIIQTFIGTYFREEELLEGGFASVVVETKVQDLFKRFFKDDPSCTQKIVVLKKIKNVA